MTSDLLAAAFKAIYGDSVHPGEISKLMDPSMLHIPGTGANQSNGNGSHKKLAGAVLLGSAAEGMATARAAQRAFPAANRVLKPLAAGANAMDKLPGKGELGLQAANLAVGLGAAGALLKKPKQPQQQVTKAARARLTPVNAIDQRHVTSARAKPPSAKPIPVSKSGGSGSHVRRVARLVAAEGLAKREPQVTWTGEIAKVDEERQQVFGWCSVSHINGVEVVDKQDDIMPIDEVEKAAYRYVLESRKGGDMHARVAKGISSEWSQPKHTADMIESFVVTPEKLEKMGLPEDALPIGWWVGYQINDPEQWDLVKRRERTGFSVHGTGTRREVG